MAEDYIESLDARIKRCVREELNCSRTNSTQSLVARTRDLIRSSASSAVRQLPSQPHQERHASHPLRLKKKRPAASSTTTKAKKSKQIFPKSVYLLDCVYNEEELGHDDDYVLKDDMVLLKGEFDLESESDELSIRCELKKVFSKKFSLIKENNFDFVKRDRNTITIPVVKDGHTWDYAHVKHLCGAGRLYVRLNVTTARITDDSSESDEELEVPTFDRSSTSSDPSTSSANASSSSTSTAGPSADSKVLTLSALFPNAKKCDIQYAIVRYDDLDAAANYLSEKFATQQQPSNNPSHLHVLIEDLERIDSAVDSINVSANIGNRYASVTENRENLSVTQILQNLKCKMNSYITAEQIKVDREDLVMDVFQHYKDPFFDPRIPLKFQLKGEPAVDTGGVRRQVYEDVFLALIKGEQGFQMFQGAPERVIPVYRSSHILTGIFEMLGKIIAHSLVQGGPGFPYLSPVLYWYIATGDLQQALARSSCIDIMGTALGNYVLKIRDAIPTELVMLRNEEEFIEIMQSSGESRLLNEGNKLEVVQALVMHEVLIKHQTSMDQMRKGLTTLGLLAEIEKYPDKFEPHFVHNDNEINKAFVKELLRLPEKEDPSTKNVVEMLLSFLDNAEKEVLANFLRFVTGCRSRSAALKPGCIRVSVEDTASIYASTCILQLKLPSHFTSLGQFQDSLCAVIDNTTFSTV